MEVEDDVFHSIDDIDDDIVYLGPALQYFLQNIKMNIRYSSIEYNIADVIPHKEKKYMDYHSLTQLFCIYIKLNDLYDELGTHIILDDLLIKAFNLPALNYSSNTSMKNALRKGLTDKALNVFEIIGLDYNIDIKLIRTILKLNIKNINDIISDDDYGRLKYQDHIIDDIFETLNTCPTLKTKELRRDVLSLNSYLRLSIESDNPLTLETDEAPNTFLLEFLHNSSKSLTLSPALRKDKRINLLFNIMEGKTNLVIGSIKEINPRCNNCDYYKLSKEYKSMTIQYVINKKMMSNLWYEKQVLINMIGDSYYDIMLHMITHIYNKYF